MGGRRLAHRRLDWKTSPALSDEILFGTQTNTPCGRVTMRVLEVPHAEIDPNWEQSLFEAWSVWAVAVAEFYELSNPGQKCLVDINPHVNNVRQRVPKYQNWWFPCGT